jgi:hypothetical protein
MGPEQTKDDLLAVLKNLRSSRRTRREPPIVLTQPKETLAKVASSTQQNRAAQRMSKRYRQLCAQSAAWPLGNTEDLNRYRSR